MFNGFLYAVVGVLLLLSALKDRKKTQMALKKAYKSLLKNLTMMATIMTLMGIVLTVVNPQFISQLFGAESGLYGIALGLGLGSVSFMPSFIAFPLGASLLESGAGYPQVAGFISSLMGVGFMSYSMESQYFGAKAAILRNGIALVASIVFVLVVGGVM